MAIRRFECEVCGERYAEPEEALECAEDDDELEDDE
jgi:hypothetical protein